MRKNVNRKPYIGFYCSEELKETVREYSDRNQLFISDVMIQAIIDYLAKEGIYIQEAKDDDIS